ncbi:MAG: rhomboid family intramembrane serine protease [Clostridiales bacterium]|nr:rhomboid family intramembrane serine protease [Clostridiales bacterium]
MRYIVFANAAVFLLDMFSGNACSALLGFHPALILRGQVWRLVTFVLVPNAASPLWFVVSLFFYYFLGTTMEQTWGTAKFNLFYFCGAGLTLIAGFIGGFFMGDLVHVWGAPTITMYQVNLSLFLAFATLYPDVQLRLYFILPVKAKWLAIFYVVVMVWDIISLPRGLWAFMLPLVLPANLASLVNYALFFWSDIRRVTGRLARRAQRRTSRQTVNFKTAQKHAREKKGYLHKCAVCGRTDTEFPDLEFRYCSKCNGYYCYCMDHINSHVHIE